MERMINAGLLGLLVGCTGDKVGDSGKVVGGQPENSTITNVGTGSYDTADPTTGSYVTTGSGTSGTVTGTTGTITTTVTGGTSGTGTTSTTGTTKESVGYCAFPTNLQCNDLSDCTYDAFVVGEASSDGGNDVLALFNVQNYLGSGESYTDTQIVASDGSWNFGISGMSFGLPNENLFTGKLLTTGDIGDYLPKGCDGLMILCGNDMGTDSYGNNYPTAYVAATDGATLRDFTELLDDGVGGWEGTATCYNEAASTVTKMKNLTVLYGSSAGK